MLYPLSNPLIVTRHKALVSVLESDFGLTDMEVIEHATAELVRDRHVIGILPIHLAAETKTFTTLSLNTPIELRGVELTEEQIRQYMGELVTYKVNKLL